MIRIHFQKDWGRYGIAFYIFREMPNGGRIPLKFTLEEQPNVHPSRFTEPSFVIDHMEEAEQVLNALAAALKEIDFLPKDTATEAELKATERHLCDMRSLVFEELKPKEIK